MSYAGTAKLPGGGAEPILPALTGTVGGRPEALYGGGVRTRAPLDVDMEDRIVFGLTPQGFGYLTIAALAALIVWHSVPYIGGTAGAVLALVGAAFGWGKYRGRPVDDWAISSARWAVRNHRLAVDERELARWWWAVRAAPSAVRSRFVPGGGGPAPRFHVLSDPDVDP